MTERTRNLKIGVFAALAIGALVAVVFFLGKRQSIFSSRANLTATFSNTSGLVPGSPVRLAGLDIGSVDDISIGEDGKQMIVSFGVDSKYLANIRKDSTAQMTTKGLLGDMMINISLGTSAQPPLKDGDRITSREAVGIAQMLGSVETVVSNVKSLTGVVDERVRTILTDKLATDLGRITSATATITEAAAHGKGLAHALLFDEELANSARSMLAKSNALAGRLDASAAHVEALLAKIENGDGLLHGVVYGQNGTRTLNELADASHEMSSILREVREGEGIVHTLIYEDDRTNLVSDLADAAHLVKKIAGEVDEGKGTVGGLLKDPTVYRDLKNVLGEVRRNVLLKALVRMTIKNDGIEAPEIADATAEK